MAMLATSVRPSHLFFHLALGAFVAGLMPAKGAATHVLVISGLAGDQKESDRFQTLRERFAADFATRGIPPANIEQAGDLNGAAILARLAKLGASLHTEDSLWLILLGHCEVRDDGPVFEVSGKRLTAQDLQTALAAIPARQYVILTPESSGAFIAELAASNRIILTATEPSGEVNETYFPEAFATALEDRQNRSLLQLAQAAAKNVRQYYDGAGLVQTEHAMLSDPSQPGPLTEPFDKTSGPMLADQSVFKGTSPAPPAPMTADQNALPDSPPSASPTADESSPGRQPATPETLAIIKQAHFAPDDGSPAIILEKDLDCLVNSDQSQVITTHQIVAIKKESGASWGDLEFSSMPPLNQVDVEKARMIFPDGTYLEADTDARSEFTSGDYLAEKKMVVRLPAVTPGCIIEYTVRQEQAADQEVSGVYQEIPVTDAVPILACGLTLRLPKDQSIHYRLRNLPGDPAIEQQTYSQVYHWSWKNLPAQDHLPFDPPLREVQGMVLISSYNSWKDFAAWYKRIAAGSDTVGGNVKARAASVTAGLKTDRDKLRALFDDVSRIHYAAIEIGVGAFRPHTPEWVLQNNYGDCKDKANLLLALARQVGIQGKFVLLNRTSSTDRSFPGFQFNHALTYFPGIDGGLWLDATDEITAFGQLPPGDVGRDGLIMDGSPDGPEFKTIPIPPAQATQLNEHIRIDVTGKTEGKMTVNAQGMTDYELRAALRGLTARETDAFFRRQLGALLPGATLKSYSISNLDHLDDPAQVECLFDPLPGSGAEMARHTPLPLDLLDAVSTPERTLPLVLNDSQPFRIEQTLDLTGFTPGHVPDKAEFTAPGGTASVHYSTQNGAWTRTLVINVTQPTISSTDYPAFRQMIHQVYLAILNTPTAQP
jgi:hypothetical protein